MTKMGSLPLLLFVAACAHPVTSKLAGHTFAPVSAVSETVHSPELDKPVEAEVGQSMIATMKRTRNPAVKLDGAVLHKGNNLGHGYQVTIPAGYLDLAGTDPSGRFFKSPKPLEFMVGSMKIPVEGGIYVPNKKDFSAGFYWMSSDSHSPLVDPDPMIEAAVIEDHAQYDADGFKRELVYSGVSQNTLSILYREFLNDMARPAFSQELRYDLSRGKTIGYKDARFEILGASNTGIRFRVLKHLE